MGWGRCWLGLRSPKGLTGAEDLIPRWLHHLAAKSLLGVDRWLLSHPSRNSFSFPLFPLLTSPLLNSLAKFAHPKHNLLKSKDNQIICCRLDGIRLRVRAL